MTDLLSVGQVAEAIGARPTDITALLYADMDLAARCPKIGHQRAIARALIPTIASLLRRKGKLLRPRSSVDQLEVEA